MELVSIMNVFSVCCFGAFIAPALLPTLAAQGVGDVPAELSVDNAIVPLVELRFVPPGPPEPVPAMQVEAAVSRREDGRTLSVLRGLPSEKDPLPEPDPAVELATRAMGIKAAAADLGVERVPTYALGLTVTVYGGQWSRVEAQDPRTKGRFSAWCGWDMELLSPVWEIEGADAAYMLFFSPIHQPADALTKDAPVVLPAAGTFVVDGEAREFGQTVVGALLDELAQRRDELKAHRVARVKYRQDKAAYEAANPPQPQDATIWLRPHEGSRYFGEAAGKEAAR